MKSLEENIFQKKYLKEHNYFERLVIFVFGCFMVAASYNIFLTPNNLIPGGVGGIATILNRLFGFTNSTTIMIMNIFLLIASFLSLGKEKTKATVLGSILFPLFVKMTENINVWIQFDTSQILLSSICGGIIYGLGVGLIFKAGFTTKGVGVGTGYGLAFCKENIEKQGGEITVNSEEGCGSEFIITIYSK